MPGAGDGTDDGRRYDCCEHCDTGGDDPVHDDGPDRHDEPCPEGCNDPD